MGNFCKKGRKREGGGRQRKREAEEEERKTEKNEKGTQFVTVTFDN